MKPYNTFGQYGRATIYKYKVCHNHSSSVKSFDRQSRSWFTRYVHPNHIRYVAPNVTFSTHNIEFKERLSLSLAVKRPFSAACAASDTAPWCEIYPSAIAQKAIKKP